MTEELKAAEATKRKVRKCRAFKFYAVVEPVDMPGELAVTVTTEISCSGKLMVLAFDCKSHLQAYLDETGGKLLRIIRGYEMTVKTKITIV
jgi:hypothetical protein